MAVVGAEPAAEAETERVHNIFSARGDSNIDFIFKFGQINRDEMNGLKESKCGNKEDARWPGARQRTAILSTTADAGNGEKRT